MNKLLCAVLALLLVVIPLSGCSGGKVEPVDSTSPVPLRENLVVYSPLPQEVLDDAVAGFTAKTGIPVETVRDTAQNLVQRMVYEADAPKADVLFGAGAELVEQFKGLFDPYQTKELAVDPRFTDPNGIWIGLTPMPIVLMYNKAQAEKAPEGWAALLGESYDGQLAFADPAKSGTSYTALCAMVQAMDAPVTDSTKAKEKTYLERFVLNLDGNLSADIAEVYSGVAEGKFLAGITLEGSVQKFLDADYDKTIGMVYPKEGTAVALEVSAIAAQAQRGDLARQFVDYVSGREFQQTLVTTHQLRTVRTDLPDPEGYTAKKDIVLLPYNVADAVNGRLDLLARFTSFLPKPSVTDSTVDSKPATK